MYLQAMRRAEGALTMLFAPMSLFQITNVDAALLWSRRMRASHSDNSVREYR